MVDFKHTMLKLHPLFSDDGCTETTTIVYARCIL